MVVGKLYQKDNQIYGRHKLVNFKTNDCKSRAKIVKFNKSVKFKDLVFMKAI